MTSRVRLCYGAAMVTAQDGQACDMCGGGRRLINRDGSGLVPLVPGEPTRVTASRATGLGAAAYIVSVGEVCPCPKCSEAGKRPSHDVN